LLNIKTLFPFEFKMVKKLQYILLKITTNNFNLKKYNPIQIIINYKKIQNLKKILAPIKERA